jgi:hypothetical protein
MLYNAFGVLIVKNASATQSCTIDISRTSLVWLFFLTIPLTTEAGIVITEAFHLVKFTGFLLITIGTLYYNHILKMPCLGVSPASKQSTVQGFYLEEKAKT